MIPKAIFDKPIPQSITSNLLEQSARSVQSIGDQVSYLHSAASASAFGYQMLFATFGCYLCADSAPIIQADKHIPIMSRQTERRLCRTGQSLLLKKPALEHVGHFDGDFASSFGATEDTIHNQLTVQNTFEVDGSRAASAHSIDKDLGLGHKVVHTLRILHNR